MQRFCALTLLLSAVLLPAALFAENKPTKSCVYIASYAPGYAWQDSIEQSLIETIKNDCQISTFHMDSKQVFQTKKLEEIGKQAANFIDQKKPDIVILSDDHAVKFVLQPFYKNSQMPFVFCGINQSGKMYGLPYLNTSGIIEKSPIESFLKILFKLNPTETHVAFLSTKGTTENKTFTEFEGVAKKLKISYTKFQVDSQREWKKAYKQLQEDPTVHIILFSNFAAIKDWNHTESLQWIKKHNHKLTIATQHSVMPYVALGLTKDAKEQGEWAGMTAKAILKGLQPSKIAVVPNQKFQFWINKSIAQPFINHLPDNIVSQSIVYREKTP